MIKRLWNRQGADRTEPVFAVAYEPELIPDVRLSVEEEGIDVLEDWFRWSEEWSMLLRVYGGLAGPFKVLEIGCGLGRIAFALRYILREGSYEGFDIAARKIDFLRERWTQRHPNFRFQLADVYNSHYNPAGAARASEFVFPYPDAAFDLVFAASVFTHMAPENARRYFAETARVLQPGRRALFSFFLLDWYRPRSERGLGFGYPRFDLEHRPAEYNGDWALADPKNPEKMTGYTVALVERLAADAGLRIAIPPVPGSWSGYHDAWVGAQDLIVLEKAG